MQSASVTMTLRVQRAPPMHLPLWTIGTPQDFATVTLDRLGRGASSLLGITYFRSHGPTNAQFGTPEWRKLAIALRAAEYEALASSTFRWIAPKRGSALRCNRPHRTPLDRHRLEV